MKKLGVAPLLLLLTLIVTLPRLSGLPGTFIYDDALLIRQNSLVQEGNLQKIWSSPYWHDQAGRGLYRPLTVSTLAMNWRLHGDNPLWYHLDNLFLHLLNVLLLFSLLGFLKINSSWRIWLTLLFGLHPMTVESVQGLVGRAELLVALFILSALWLWGKLLTKKAVGHSRKPRHLYLGGIAVAYLLAMLCKEHAVVLPLLLALFWVTLHRPKLPFSKIELAGATLLPLLVVMSLRLKVLDAQAPEAIVIGVDGVWQHLLVIFQVLGKSAASLLLPYRWQWDLAPFAMLPAKTLNDPYVLIGLVVVGGLILSSRAFQQKPLLLLAWWVVPLLTVLHLVPIGVIFAERFLYLPLAMLPIALATLPSTRLRFSRKIKRLAAVLALAPLMIFAIQLYHGHSLWKSELDFWRYTQAQSPNSLSSNLNLAVVYQRQGDQLNAEKYYRQNIALAPQTSLAWGRLGELYFEQQRFSEANEALSKMLRLQPSAKVFNLWALNQLSLGEMKKAEQGFLQAVALAPEVEAYAVNLILFYLQSGNSREAKKRLVARNWSTAQLEQIEQLRKQLR